MKRWMIFGGLWAALTLGPHSAIWAEDDHGTGGSPDAMGDGMDGGMKGGHLDRMKEKLGLTDDQAAKLKDLFQKQREETRPLRDQMRIDMDVLQQKVDAKASDGEIKKILDTLSAERKNLQTRREKMVDQIREILNPTQQAKFVLGMRAWGKGMMEKGRGQWRHGWKAEGPGHGKDGSAPNNNGGNGEN